MSDLETVREGSLATSWAERSVSVTKLAAALSKAQAQIEAVHKDSNNPYYKSKYADLASVWDAIRAPLTSNGLSVLQEPTSENGCVALITTLLHESGEYTRSRLRIPVLKQDAQGYGSAITYARRYSLQAIAGVAPEDDDGNAAVGQRIDNVGNPKKRVGSQETQSNGTHTLPHIEPSPTKTLDPHDHDPEQVMGFGKGTKTAWKDCPIEYLQWLFVNGAKKWGEGNAFRAGLEIERRQSLEPIDEDPHNGDDLPESWNTGA